MSKQLIKWGLVMAMFRALRIAVRALNPGRDAIRMEAMRKELKENQLSSFTLPEGFVFHEDRKFLGNLTEQFIEFVRVIDKVDFFTVRDVDDSKPWLQIAYASSDSIYLNIGSDRDYDLAALPWLENISEFQDNRFYEIPREFFTHPERVSYLLSVIYRGYTSVVIEFAEPEKVPQRFKALFPVVPSSIEPTGSSAGETGNSGDGIVFNLPVGFEFHRDEVFLKKLTDQFIEFVRVIDNVEFFTIEDPKGLKPFLQILPWSDEDVLLNMNSSLDYDFSALPSIVNQSEESGVCQYVIPRQLFSDLPKVRYLLSVIYEHYDSIVISEIVNIGPALKMKTYFPVETPNSSRASSSRSGAGAGVAAAAGAAASIPSTKFFFARTEEEQASGEESSSFDWL